MKSMIIVTDKKTERYGNYLRGLISQNDDHDGVVVGTKDGDVVVEVYTEEQYKDNKATIASTQKVLFIGNGKISQKERHGFNRVFEKYGMVFGSLGTHAFLFVEKVVPIKEYGDFIEYAQSIQKDVKQISINTKDVSQIALGTAAGATGAGVAGVNMALAAGAGAGLIGWEAGTTALGVAVLSAIVPIVPVLTIAGGAVLAGGGISAVKYNTKRKDIEGQQYDCLVLKCYLDNLREFIG